MKPKRVNKTHQFVPQLPTEASKQSTHTSVLALKAVNQSKRPSKPIPYTAQLNPPNKKLAKMITTVALGAVA
jgi:hypothetical protein